MGYALRANAIRSASFHPDAATTAVHGVVTTRAAAALPQTAVGTLFTIAGGHILLRQILGIVTVVIGSVANATKLSHNPDPGAGSTTDICATVELNAAAVDSVLSITGTLASAMVKSVNIVAVTQATALVMPPGGIEVNCAGSDGGTGRVRWVAVWVPLDPGATLVAA